MSRLLGDFTFAVWDEPRQRLFCARDQLGVKPFFYAQLGQTVLFSNTLDCIRLHPAVSRDLNDPAIADFLLFGANQEIDTTSFRDIRRLPPAHSITWSNGMAQCRRYWTLPVEEPIHFKRADDYSDRFTELLRAALRDRLRTRRVGVLMSGGLDSPTLAAVALSLLRECSSDFFLQAITSVYDRLIPDSERHYAGLVADYLNIPIRYDVRDDETSIADWDQVSVHTPEPVDNPPAFAAGVEFFKSDDPAGAACFCMEKDPITRCGTSGAPTCRISWPDDAWRSTGPRAVERSVDASARAVLVIDSAVGRRQEAHRKRWRELFPGWLNEEFADTVRLQREMGSASSGRLRHRTPSGLWATTGSPRPRWQPLFDDCDINGALSHCEIRHPFLDLRLVQYMLALPAMPWCRNKLIIRRSMRTALPGCARAKERRRFR